MCCRHPALASKHPPPACTQERTSAVASADPWRRLFHGRSALGGALLAANSAYRFGATIFQIYSMTFGGLVAAQLQRVLGCGTPGENILPQRSVLRPI